MAAWLGVAWMATAHAQTAVPRADTRSVVDPQAPASESGASKYTASEIRALIEARGYHPVTRLRLDSAGTWHALAEQYGKTIEVSVDQRGNLSVARERN
ncbi:MAG: hypothetical protein SFV21_15550 [Rhodospirillaceae bacterium]|nr:hypothetical protein [Rhodospirillaceae bacterium]